MIIVVSTFGVLCANNNPAEEHEVRINERVGKRKVISVDTSVSITEYTRPEGALGPKPVMYFVTTIVVED